uniref:NPC1_N domain-containing protein n=1 Tax=Macrostomum lignano TaxID=282301 RepID=A0A1I8FG56_9PLAT
RLSRLGRCPGDLDKAFNCWSFVHCRSVRCPNRPRFVSNLFGSLGAGMNVLPNLIDFGKLFDNWQGKLAGQRCSCRHAVFKYLPLIDDLRMKKFVYRITCTLPAIEATLEPGYARYYRFRVNFTENR